MKPQKNKVVNISAELNNFDERSQSKIIEALNDLGLNNVQVKVSYGYNSKEDVCHLRELANIVAKSFGITIDDLVSRSRLQTKVFARHAFHQLAREHFLFPLQKVGCFTLRNHTTVLHSCNEVQSLIESKNPLFICGYNKANRILKQKEKSIMETYFDFVQNNLNEYLEGERTEVELIKAERIEIAGGVVFNIVAMLDEKPINVVGDNAELTMKQLLKSIEDITIGVEVYDGTRVFSGV